MGNFRGHACMMLDDSPYKKDLKKLIKSLSSKFVTQIPPVPRYIISHSHLSQSF